MSRLLKEQCLRHIRLERRIYYKLDASGKLCFLVAVYVDEILFSASKSAAVMEFECNNALKYKIKARAIAKEYVGVRISMLQYRNMDLQQQAGSLCRTNTMV